MPRKKAQPRAEALKDVVVHDARPISLSITMNGQTMEYRGNTVMEAIEQIVTPKVIKGKCRLVLNTGNMQASKNFYPMFLRRLTSNKLSREILQKQLAVMLH